MSHDAREQAYKERTMPDELPDPAPTKDRGESLFSYETPFRWREPLAAILSTVLFEWLIFRGHGFSGVAAFVIGWCALLWIGSPRRNWQMSSTLLASLLLAVAVKFVWQGDDYLVGAAVVLIAAFSLTLWGQTPFVLYVFAQGMQVVPGGVCSLIYSVNNIVRRWRIPQFWSSLNVTIPAALVFGFGGIFILANPNLTEWVQNAWTYLSETFWETLGSWVPTPQQFFLWTAIALCTFGLIRPLLRVTSSEDAVHVAKRKKREKSNQPLEPIFQPDLYLPYRNTLLSLIVLFVIYLAFEFSTLWFREFPKGFYYAGYAHAGAGWLTLALALATASLSVIFQADILTDERLPQLKKLAWIWSGLNLLLAIAVYHRLAIYIEFNGMTRMRVVGLLGVSTVVVGFLLVIRKIARQYNFAWLIQRQLWTPSIAIILYLIIPVDWLVHSWNARQIRAGHLAPSVQITEHEVDTGGMLALFPLIDCEDPIIRDGVRGMIMHHSNELRQSQSKRNPTHWTAYQHAESRLFELIAENSDKLAIDVDELSYRDAWIAFRKYAYQWY